MSDEQTKGTVSDVKGTVKEGVGRLTGDKDVEAEGTAQKTQGEAQKKLGDVQDTLRGDSDRDRR